MINEYAIVYKDFVGNAHMELWCGKSEGDAIADFITNTYEKGYRVKGAIFIGEVEE